MKSRSRKVAIAAWLAGLAASLLLPALLLAQQKDDAAFRRVSDRLICQCGCNYGLSHCPHLDCPSAPVLRQAIREKLAAGLSEEQVLKAMVADFGPAVLGAPPAEGFNWSAWIMPFAALLVGLYLVQRVVRAWRRRQPAATVDPALVERYQKSIEREMKHLEE
jgi:cytochrome c-type biogenesis protein CcmH